MEAPSEFDAGYELYRLHRDQAKSMLRNVGGSAVFQMRPHYVQVRDLLVSSGQKDTCMWYHTIAMIAAIEERMVVLAKAGHSKPLKIG